MAFNGNTLAIVLLVSVIVYLLFFRKCQTVSSFVLEGAPLMEADDISKPLDTAGSAPKQMKTSGNDYDLIGSVMESLSSAALLPKEIPITDDFGQFSTEQILSGQNYLDPRGQIGYPETVGGTLRNANLQIRSEPANPRDPVSIWNLSTIAPEQMRPLFEIQDKEYA